MKSDLSALLDAVHCMDNCNGMMQIPNDSIDLVVTSPPYDDLRTYGGHSWDFYGVAWNLARVLKPGGVIVWVVGDATIKGSETCTSWTQAMHIKDLGLNLHDTMIYAKKNVFAYDPRNARYKQAFEYMFVFTKGKPKTYNPINDVPNKKSSVKGVTSGRNKKGEMRKAVDVEMGDFQDRKNIWEYGVGMGQTTKDKEAYKHPALMPEDLAKDHIKSWSNKGDIVLDPFMGSGTTAKAAQELGRHYIGFEINPEYVEICQRRTAQTTLGI